MKKTEGKEKQSGEKTKGVTMDLWPGKEREERKGELSQGKGSQIYFSIRLEWRKFTGDNLVTTEEPPVKGPWILSNRL